MSISRVLHFDVPKSAGDVLRRFFCDQIGAGRVSPDLHGLRLSDALLRWGQIDVLSGQFNVHRGDALPRDRISLTVLLDPLDRFLSEFLLRNHSDARSLRISSGNLDLDGYIDSLVEQPLHAQTQIELFYPLGTQSPHQLDVGQKLRAAQSAIDMFDVIGIDEDIANFCSLITAQMHWSQLPPMRAETVQTRLSVDDLSVTQRRKIEHLLQAEIELYQYAKDRFLRDSRRLLAVQSADLKGAESNDSHPERISANRANAQRSVERRPGSPRDFGDRRCEIRGVAVSAENSGLRNVTMGGRITVDIRFVVSHPVDRICIGIAINDRNGALMHGVNSLALGNHYVLGAGSYQAKFSFANRLGIGSYSVDCALTPADSRHAGCYHWQEQAARFEVFESSIAEIKEEAVLDDVLVLTMDCGELMPLPVPAKPALV